VVALLLEAALDNYDLIPLSAPGPYNAIGCSDAPNAIVVARAGNAVYRIMNDHSAVLIFTINGGTTLGIAECNGKFYTGGSAGQAFAIALAGGTLTQIQQQGTTQILMGPCRGTTMYFFSSTVVFTINTATNNIARLA